MAVAKRKAAMNGANGAGAHKKLKTETRRDPAKKATNIRLETETDSDPIVESDTASHSGDDDGVSWPSDSDGGALLPQSARAKKPTQPAPVPAKQHSLSKRESSQTSKPKTSRPGVKSNPEAGQKNPPKPDADASRPAHTEQKALARARRATKPHADVVARAKRIWEQLRRQSRIPKDERRALVDELFTLLSGRAQALARRHDASRIIQTGIKYGDKTRRRALAEELKGSYVELAQSTHAKFLVGKLLARGNDAVRDIVVPEFFGHVRKLMRHPEAAWVLDDIYRGAATPNQKARMLREWYGAAFPIFDARLSEPLANDAADLRKMLAETPEKRGVIMKGLWEMINALVQKKTGGFTMLHDAMLQYLLNVSDNHSDTTTFIELLKDDEEGDLLKNLAFTSSGARVVALALAHGTAKDRKQILRMYKGLMRDLATHQHGYMVLLVALDVIDDTVLTSKMIYGELFPASTAGSKKTDDEDPVLAAATHPLARVLLLYPFVDKFTTLFKNAPAALTVIREAQEIRALTSKKDPVLRRSELARALAPTVYPSIATQTRDFLAAGDLASTFVTEALLCGPTTDKRDLAVDALARLAATPEHEPIIGVPGAARMLKSLVLSGRFDFKTRSIVLSEPRLGFADRLYEQWGKEGTVGRAIGPLAFVVLGLLESGDFEKVDELKAALRKKRGMLEQAVNGEVESKESAARKGTQLIIETLDEEYVTFEPC